MPAAVRMREDYSAEALRSLAKRSKDANQSRRLLSLAAVRDGMDRGAAARIGGMDRQTLRDWNAAGPEGFFDHWTEGPKPRLSPEQLAEFAAIVETGPNRKVDGVVRWRRIDLKRVIVEKFGVDYHQRYIGKLLKKLGFSHISARPRHPAQDERIVEAFKKLPARLERPSRRVAGNHAGRNSGTRAASIGSLPCRTAAFNGCPFPTIKSVTATAALFQRSVLATQAALGIIVDGGLFSLDVSVVLGHCHLK